MKDVHDLHCTSNISDAHVTHSQTCDAMQALMAKEAVLKFNPEAKILAHHGNVKELQFGMSFVRKFDLVLNALDNVDARRYVATLFLF